LLQDVHQTADDEIEKGEMGRECGSFGRKEKVIQGFGGES
jgi:hypothetical protein